MVAGKQSLPGHKTPLDQLYLCGDFTYRQILKKATVTPLSPTKCREDCLVIVANAYSERRNTLRAQIQVLQRRQREIQAIFPNIVTF